VSRIDIVVDLETTANGPKDSPEAQWPDNRVLYWGWMSGSNPVSTSDKPDDLMNDIWAAYQEGWQVRIIGHNLKFDLKYMMKARPDFPWHKFDYCCTMHRHYRYTGHKDKFMSLEDLAKHHGIPFTKTLDLGALLKSGVKMEDIPESDLVPYLIEDVQVTRQINMYQDTVDKHLDSALVLPLAHMELLGLGLDKKKASALMTTLVTDEAMLAKEMELFIATGLRWSNGDPVLTGEVKFNAPRTISYLLTGKPVSGIVCDKRTLEWKKGFNPLLRAPDFIKFWPGKTPTNLGFPMPADKLKQVQAAYPTFDYIKWVLEYRKIQKLMGTYVGPFLEKTKYLPTIHPKMHVVSTATGRLSSAEPNGQNLPPTARELFESEHGQFMEIDFSQLEVCALAAITEDPALIGDLVIGEDVHYNSGCRVMGWKKKSDMTKEGRTIVKRVNFGLIYGGGAASLALQTGQDKKLVKQLIDSFYKRYPGVGIWQEKFYKEVVANLLPFDVKDGEQRYASLVKLPISNRWFHFVESESPKWLKIKTGRKYSFKPTETKNYPVQGFAGGDIVMLALVLLHHALWDEIKTEIRMTVHDSILVDTCMSEAKLRAIMAIVCGQLRAAYSLPFDLEFDITSGTHWR
jgi:DNA polymerase I-like protein with 3'-5' exonuclease and polymerase domains